MTLTSAATVHAPSTTGVEVAVDPRDPMQRLLALFDPGTLRPLAPLDEGGVLSACGDISGSSAVAFATDPTRQAGALGATDCARIVQAINLAALLEVPIVGIWHSGGAQLREGVASLDGLGSVFKAIVAASGKTPQISVVLGPSAGGAAYGPALTDVVIMSESGRIFVTGPDIVRSVTGQDVDMRQLGGPAVHTRRSGVAHVAAPDDVSALATAAAMVSLLGNPGTVDAEPREEPRLGELLPEQQNRAYDVRPLVDGLLDAPGIDLHARWAPNVVTTLGRFAGRTVGVLANNPLRLGGCLTSAAAEKAARFVRFCDSFGIPLLVLVDVPGYLPGVDQESEGVVRRGAKLLHAFAEAVVPRVTLVTRKAYGGAYIAMNSRSLGATAVFAWPAAEVAVMGAGAAAKLLHRRALAAAPPENRAQLLDLLTEEQRRTAGSIDRALEIGVVDAVIEPGETRRRIAEVLASADPVRGDHRNIPL